MAAFKNKILLAGLVLVNLIIWPLWIIPGLAGIFHSGTRMTAPNIARIDNTTVRTADRELPYGNPERWRNPFFTRDDPAARQAEPSGNRPIKKPAAVTAPAREKFVSRFRLKSIVQSNDKFIASLEEIPPQSPDENANQPYSYRFGAQQETIAADVTYDIHEGEELQGEKAVKIGENYMVLSKNGQYYKLTFSGGQPVDKP